MDRGIGIAIGAFLIFGTGIVGSVLLGIVYGNIWAPLLFLLVALAFGGMYLFYELSQLSR